MRRLLLVLLILFLTLAINRSAVSAQTTGAVPFYPGESLAFENLTVEDGLSQNTIQALLQDQRGYLWIGTQDGLDRYDGLTFTHFRNDPANLNSLSFNSILSLYQDPQGSLWIGTWGGGLNRYDPDTGQFTRYLPDPNNPGTLSDPVVTAIVQGANGMLWVGTLGGLDLLDPTTGWFNHFRSDVTDPTSLSSNAISVITPAADGTFWIGTGAYGTAGAGLDRFDPATGKSEHIQGDSVCLNSPDISAIVLDPIGSLWVGHGGSGLPGGGLDFYNPVTGSCLHYDRNTTGGRFVNNNVTHLLFDQDNRLWITVWGGGLLRMELNNTRDFVNIRHDPADPESLSSNSLSTMMQDRSGVLWIGTFDSGINKLNLENLQFRTYENNSTIPSSLASNRVSSFAQTSDGKMWIGTLEAGLDQFNPATGQFKHYTFIPSNPSSLSSNRILSLYADTDGTLWVGTANSGLNHYDPATDKFQHYQHDSANPASLIDDEINYILRDSSGSLWVATMGGLSRLDPGSRKFVNYTGLSGAPVTMMADGGDLWIGTWGGGVAKLSLALPGILPPDKNRIAALFTLQHDAADPNTISENSVWAINKTSDGFIWFGTADGLNRFDPRTGKFKVYNEQNGLRNAVIRSISEDPDGILWITTTNGMARFDPRTEDFHIYDKTDGLQGNEFNSNASFYNRTTGEIYVGGTHGFTMFNPLAITNNPIPPNVVFTDFSVFGQSYTFDEQGKIPIRLNYRQNFISVNFTALDFHAPLKNTYAYTLNGYDDQWIQAGTRHTAAYTNLPPGDYTFHVKAANSDGIWSTTDATLTIQIVPPFWQRWQFQAGLIVGVVALIAAGFQWRTRTIRRNALILEERIAERTAALNKANELLREKSAQDAVTAERTRLARELHDAVTQTLFSATLVADVLPELWKTNRGEGDRRLEELRQLTRGALAEMRTLLVELRPNALMEVPLPSLLRQLTDAMVGRAHIDIQFFNTGERKLPADVQIGLYRIAQESLNNVIKHSKASQAVITLRMEAEVRMSVTDNGVGFDPSAVTADHLGLKIMRERAEAIGAEFNMYSEPGEGTQISVIWHDPVQGPAASGAHDPIPTGS